MRKTAGVVKVVAHEDVVVGVHMVGDRTGELIGEALMTLAGKPLHVHAPLAGRIRSLYLDESLAVLDDHGLAVRCQAGEHSVGVNC